jgi:hypothetical protein
MCAGEGEEMIFKKRQEYHLQQDVHQWFITQYPKAFQTISPAGIRLPVWIGAKFKGMGYRKGSLDYMIFKMKKLGGVVFGGCFVEIKMPGGATSKEQKQVAEELRAAGYIVFMCPCNFKTENEAFSWIKCSIAAYMSLQDYVQASQDCTGQAKTSQASPTTGSVMASVKQGVGK